MAKTLSKSGIVNGQGVEAWHVSQSVDAFTKVDAYDITVSGSFKVTGSLKVRGTVFGRTSTSASLAITSSYAGYTPTVTSASRADYNSSNQYTLQFYSPTTIAGFQLGRIYGIGAGEELISGPGTYGITLPVDSQVVGNVTVVSICKTEGMTTSELQLMSGDSTSEYTFGNPVQYKDAYSYFDESPNTLTFPSGTRLWFKLTTDTQTPIPTYVSHNIILTLKPING